MKRTITLVAALALTTACASHTERGPAFTTADAADLGSTAAFLATGNGVEINPLLGGSPAETLLKGGIMKLGARAAINAIPVDDRERKNLHTFMNATGYGVTASNIPLAFTANPAPLLGALVGLGYFIYSYEGEPTDE